MYFLDKDSPVRLDAYLYMYLSLSLSLSALICTYYWEVRMGFVFKLELKGLHPLPGSLQTGWEALGHGPWHCASHGVELTHILGWCHQSAKDPLERILGFRLGS